MTNPPHKIPLERMQMYKNRVYCSFRNRSVNLSRCDTPILNEALEVGALVPASFLFLSLSLSLFSLATKNSIFIFGLYLKRAFESI